ncbi:MAG: TVP38/TMEM64 family protein [Bdellovibrionaceae bacterium]|nr:TVP38/TMEM64 family protein [Pseudobdellovibrionaceae bacterium]
MSKLKILTIFCIIFIFVIVFKLDLTRYLDINFFINQKDSLFSFYENSPLLFIFIYFCIYVFCATLSIPGAPLLTLVSGFLFDFWIGSLVVSLGSTLGAVFAFLISRFLMADFVEKKLSKKLIKINEGLKKDGVMYLFSLRIIPIFPYFMVNILLGVTSISLKKFTIGSFLGMLPGTFVYVNAGKQLNNISSISQIFSLEVIFSFILLAFLPWILKWILKLYKK